MYYNASLYQFYDKIVVTFSVIAARHIEHSSRDFAHLEHATQCPHGRKVIALVLSKQI